LTRLAKTPLITWSFYFKFLYNGTMFEPQYAHIGMIARWRPVHKGQKAVLRALCCSAGYVLLGIGSSNRYNARNPFTLAETEDMLHLVLEEYDNYRIIPVPDLDDGPCWRAMVLDLFGALDVFVTDNPYVASLLKEDYHLMRPVDLVPPRERIRVDGSMIRVAMARGERWQDGVPAKIARYIEENALDARFRREFGLETLALQTVLE
jgi:nicotinamide-nucleotide adenylyltransferase